MTQDELMVELMGGLKGIETIASDQQHDDETSDQEYYQKTDARMGILKRESERLMDLLSELGDTFV